MTCCRYLLFGDWGMCVASGHSIQVQNKKRMKIPVFDTAELPASSRHLTHHTLVNQTQAKKLLDSGQVY